MMRSWTTQWKIFMPMTMRETGRLSRRSEGNSDKSRPHIRERISNLVSTRPALSLNRLDYLANQTSSLKRKSAILSTTRQHTSIIRDARPMEWKRGRTYTIPSIWSPWQAKILPISQLLISRWWNRVLHNRAIRIEILNLPYLGSYSMARKRDQALKRLNGEIIPSRTLRALS